MLSTRDYIETKSASSGRGRFEYLQALVTEFQDTDKHGKDGVVVFIVVLHTAYQKYE